MAAKTQRNGRRADALSKERIVEAAIDILDRDGESALTFRALAARLSTGSGAIYWHIADKNALLVAAADAVISGVVTDRDGYGSPREAIRMIALSVFDAIDAHPWVGTQLAREPWQPAMVHIFESVGTQLQALSIAEEAQFNSASALVSYLLGLATQYAAVMQLVPRETDRSAFLTAIASQWTQHDPAKYPFVHQIAAQLPEHDDREQFLAGIDLFLAGIDAGRST
ncbi:TetR/AcrR family transcriptional regulator [Mycolicibacterium sphagni]|uniref:TetR family transcriptional regulator n=1 Tax=Mycolicibacterium sphagni TaxID=1786 RepID=A0A255DYB1_9MYCO|nr:TetR family transcriptional regulator [Mycolicibacterium sphagni]OYN82275.1 TetR family transcriptional regulator [Mycolicibacterium sphagni]